MSIQSELTRITTARNTIRNKLVNLGLAESTDSIDDLATEVNDIVNRGAVSAQVQEGETYTIPAGYHNGSGTVQGVGGGSSYTLQTKTVTPTKSQQSITPDSGYYGLSGVTVNAIPEAYQDVSSVDAVAADVLANKKIVTSDGTLTAGTMINNGAVSQTLDATTTSYTIPAGYHNGSGSVGIVAETKSVTPGAAAQIITPTAGKVLTEVDVAAIDGDTYKDTTDATALETQILYGATAYGYDSTTGKATKLTGSMVNNAAISASIDGLTTTSYTVPAGYHNGSGTVSLTNAIESALALI